MVSATVIPLFKLLLILLMYFKFLTVPFWCLWQLKRKTDAVNQIAEPNELNIGVLQTPVSGKGGKAKKTSRSVKSNKSGTQASGSNAG